MTRTAVIITAAGSGTRVGASEPKAFLPIGGVPMVVRAARAAVDAFSPAEAHRTRSAGATSGEAPLLSALIVTAPPSDVERMRTLLLDHGIDAIVVEGGQSRADSVCNALAAVSDDVDSVLVHDAARCLASPGLFRSVCEAAAIHGAVVPTVPVVDSLRKAGSGAIAGAPVARDGVAIVQTPQGFSRGVLQRAVDAAISRGDLADATDESSMVSALDDPAAAVHVVDGEVGNLKITTAGDLEMANLRCGAAARAGVGVDAHAFDRDSSSPLALACLQWTEMPALAGHSDGDVAAHAVCDAMFAAAGLGDLGQQFGVDDERWRGASGAALLAETVLRLREAGWRPTSATVEIIGNAPKIGPRRAEAEAAMSAAVGIPVHISATTTDGMGLTGRGEGLAAIASATVGPLGT